MKTRPLRLLALAILVSVAIPFPVAAQSAGTPVVRAVLFYSPNCSHCHHVITELLQPMQAEYGGRLQILGIDTSQATGSKLYRAAIERYEIPAARRGVPTLVVGDTVLVGSGEIPDQFPSLVEEGLAAGGIAWPDLPLLDPGEPAPVPTLTPRATVAPVLTSTAAPEPTPSVASTPTPASPVARLDTVEDEALVTEEEGPSYDPVGFVLAGLVLVGMGLGLGYSFWRMSRPGSWQHIARLVRSDRTPTDQARSWAIPVLALVGLAVASYLAYVEVTHVAAVCGPVGECNVVQSSSYALLLGVPVAVWGVLNYLAVIALWAGQRFLPERAANLSLLALLGLTLFGTLFSIYLTCLELFAIRAICLWCLSSAVITTALMLVATHAVTSTEHLSRPRSGASAVR